MPEHRHPLRVASVQCEPRPDDKAFNLARIGAFTARASEQRARFVAFPEMCLLGYWHLRRHDRESWCGWPSRSTARPSPRCPPSPDRRDRVTQSARHAADSS
ncbi:nitrilase-related carbon-nitrogen hydrolase [Phytomonospora sp. NPDC050363]|uniref:nitrilase-related carbon-nitrogen hydrolase n=1 Tax=Phytomonospora sp. NPDC050363 TaxID=3155642 RepID=UPI003406E1DD